jgi:hypothetical protein
MRPIAAAAIVLVLAAGCGSGRPAPTKRAAPTFADKVEVACLQRNGELQQLSRPRNQVDFVGYVVSMLNIVRYYRGQLAALHPKAGGDAFARYRRLLRADEASAVALLKAVRGRNRRAVARLMAEQRSRSSREQALLKRVGVSC